MFKLDWITDGPDEIIRAYADQVRRAVGEHIQVVTNEAEVTGEATIGFSVDNPMSLPRLKLRGSSASRDSALHEILHLRRWYVLDIPRLVASDADQVRGGEFENEIEHSVVVPVQADLGYLGLRDALAAKSVAHLPQLTNAEPLAMRVLVLRIRAFGDSFKAAVEEFCAKQGFSQELHAAVRELSALNASNAAEKRKLVRAILPKEKREGLRLVFMRRQWPDLTI